MTIDRRYLLAQLVIGVLGFFPAISRGWASEADSTALHRSIERLVSAKAGGPVAGRSDDAEFLRRVSLDLSGQIPSASEVRAFLKNESPDKRTQVIDQLLAGDAFAKHWTDRLSVMLLKRQDLGKVPDDDWRRYLESVLHGTPKWDILVREMIAGHGKGDARPAMKFLGNGDHHRLTEDIAQLFLGMDLKCARCHDHPSVDDWKQAHYWGLHAYLSQTKRATHAKDKREYFVEGLAMKRVDFQSVFSNKKESTGPKLPEGEEVPIPQFEKGEEFEMPAADGLPPVPKFRPRMLLADDLTGAGNQLFAQNSVNRIWFLMMGRGLVHPLDQMHSGNPASHPELLTLLANAFAAHGFDLKWLLREIALSECYQRSSRLPAGVKPVEPSSFRSAIPRGLTPEQMLHALLRATETTVPRQSGNPDEKFDRRGYITGTNNELPSTFDDIRGLFVEVFGEPPGFAEVEFAPGVQQALFLMNDRLILHWVEPREGNLVDRLSKVESSAALADELYLSVLSRLPEDLERTEVADHLRAHAQRRSAAVGDLVWALINSSEFRMNH